MALAPLLVALTAPGTHPAPSPFRAFSLGLTTGVVSFTGTLYWLPDVMVTFGGLPYVLAVLAAALLVAYLALFPALFAMAVSRTWPHFGPVALLLAPAFWVTTELAREVALTGFPWVPLGNSQVSVLPIAQIASVVGVYGLSGFVAAGSAVVVYALRRETYVRFVPLLLLICVALGASLWGHHRLLESALVRAGRAVRVGIVQGNVLQDQKWDPAHAPAIFSRYLSLSRRAASQGAQLIVWPESSTPFLLEEHVEGREALTRLARETGSYLLIGSDKVERDASPPRYYNAAYMLTPEGEIAGVYRKMHLVPFGEYVPLKRILFFASPIIEAVSDFSAGAEVVLFPTTWGRVSTAICYEVVFPGLMRDAVRKGSHLLTTITNDAWYGQSSAPWQHFEMARLRAVEQGRYLVRSANTGISGIVDPYGRVLARTDLFVPAVLVNEIRSLDAQTIYARIGNAPVYACALLTVLTLALTFGGKRRRAR